MMNSILTFVLMFPVCAAHYSPPYTGLRQDKVITDSRMTPEEAVSGLKIPRRIKDNLRLVDVKYYSFDGKLHQGQILIHRDLAEDIQAIFRDIEESRFPIAKAIPIAKYHWSDSLSMAGNNTSAFNYRLVKGTRFLSEHSSGRAIDINPIQNPQISKGKASPPGSRYDTRVPGTITPSSSVVKAFQKRGWKWGAAWKSTKDYQHFEKK